MEGRLAKIRVREHAQKQKYLKGDQASKKRKVDGQYAENDDVEQFVLDDYDSDGENASTAPRKTGVYSTETLALMERLGMSTEPKKRDADEDEDEAGLKVGLLDFKETYLICFCRSFIAPELILN